MPIKIKLTVGERDVPLDLPSTVEEVTLEQYFEFQDAYNRNKENDKQHLVALDTVSAFFGFDPEDLLGNQLSPKKIEGFDNAIMPIFYHIVRLFNTYKFDTNPNKPYVIAGENYYLPYTMFGQNSPTVSEAIEVLEIKRLLNTGTKDGRFTEAIKTAAILLRKKGEKLPLLQPDIDKFIEDRVQYFAEVGISMQAGLDSVFFSTITIWA